MDYKKIYESEVFAKSQCIWRENSFVDFLRTLLDSHGYVAQDERRFVWQKFQRRIYIAIVDDINQLNYNTSDSFIDSLTSDDIVITDSWFNRPARCQIIQLPNSWFGIYAYQPSELCAVPDRDYSMPINRIDFNRMHLMLDMHSKGLITDQTYVNFNCARHTDKGDVQDQKDLWDSNWQNIPGNYKDTYQQSFDELREAMPFKNHSLDIDTMSQSGLVNIVVETYNSDHSVSLSEKIFRALVTPRPWRLLSGTWSVARLKSLGFDTLDDIVSHDTDGLHSEECKIEKFVDSCRTTITSLEWESIESRCKQAAAHNQDLLFWYRSQWANEIGPWMNLLSTQI